MEAAEAMSTPNVVLIGMRASGKSTLGRELARRLEWPFTDLDEELARLAGRSADELLAREGEAVFRAHEERVLRAAASLRGHVIATGGGAVLHREAFGALAATGHVVYLRVGGAELLRRGAARPRPPLTALTPEAEVAALLAQRDPLYREAARITVGEDEREPILALLRELSRREPTWMEGR